MNYVASDILVICLNKRHNLFLRHKLVVCYLVVPISFSSYCELVLYRDFAKNNQYHKTRH